MLKSVRVPERAYAIMLWVLSLVFASFIVGFGGLVIGDLPQIEQQAIDQPPAPDPAQQRIKARLDGVAAEIARIDDKRTIAQLQLDQARKASETATDTFRAWIATRTATSSSAQDPEVLKRTRDLGALKANERAQQEAINALDNQRAPLVQQQSALEAAQNRAIEQAGPARERARFGQELRIFLLRLAITLPMLLIAAWLVVKKRRSDYWPLARGFVLAAIFVFFVELVPYLPSYGGYVRYGVGIALTFAAGVFLVRNMRAYLVRRQAVEARAEAERRRMVNHDEAFRKMSARQCPGCDRPIATMDGSETNFCVHCGMTLYDHCPSCHARKMAFFRYCMACGTPAASQAGEISPAGA